MASLEVTVSVTGQDIDLVDQIKDELKRRRLRVKKNPGACAACKANDNPELVPFRGCNSARGRQGNRCRCTVEVVEDTDRR